jgi:hypothetical protein
LSEIGKFLELTSRYLVADDKSREVLNLPREWDRHDIMLRPAASKELNQQANRVTEVFSDLSKAIRRNLAT